MRIIDIKGQKFGRLLVLKRYHRNSNDRRTLWECVCDCGNSHIIDGRSLRKGSTKSCGCWKNEFNQLTRRLRPFENAYNRLPLAASNRKLELTLTYEEYLEFTKISSCHYCGEIISWQSYAGKGDDGVDRTSIPYYLDRKDNNLGYTKENCVVCCTRCNRGKMHLFSYKEWKEMAAILKAMRNKENYAYIHKD